jgi:RimJ/RimL family protein N-acetyltransferase
MHFERSQTYPDLWRFSLSRMTSASDMRVYFDTALGDLAAGNSVPFSIFLVSSRGEATFAGSTRIANIAPDHQRLEIGWSWLLPDFQRTGLNQKVKLLLLTHCFEDLLAARVEFKGDARNDQSRAALAKIGAQYEGTLRSHMLLPDSSRRDSFYFSILKIEWPAVKASIVKGLGNGSL